LLTALLASVLPLPTDTQEAQFGLEINCVFHSDPIGANLTHTADRRTPCEGEEIVAGSSVLKQARSKCVVRHSLPLSPSEQLWAGCCLPETRGGKLFCSTLRSVVASAAAQTTSKLLVMQYTCQGGAYLKTAPPPSDNVGDCSAWQPYQGIPICNSDNSCTCMRGARPDPTFGCTCHPPNTGAQCVSSADCTGGGECVGESGYAKQFLPIAQQDEDVEIKRAKDGQPQIHPKETSWFGDEGGPNIKPRASFDWQYEDPLMGWTSYSPLNLESLEAAWLKGEDRATVQWDGLAFGDAWVSLTEMIQFDAQARIVRVKRVGRVAGGLDRPEIIDAMDGGVLESEEALRRRTVSP